MKRLSCLCSLAFLAAFVAGCGKDPEADSKAAAAPADVVDFDTLMRDGVAAVAQNDAAAATAAAAKALELQPQSAEARLLAGQAACLKDDYVQAREQFAAVIAEKSLPAALRAKAYVGKGTVEFLQHDADSARISFLHARLLDFNNEAALYYLGLIYRDVYRFYEAAEEHFRVFARMSKPDDARARKVNYEVVPELRRMLASIAAARPGASSGNATQAAALIQQAKALEDKKRISEAVKKYDAARKADPQSDVAALGYARLVKATEKSKEGARKAIQAYCDVISLKPGVLSNYLEAARLAREYEPEFRIQAVEIMNRAVAHHPDKRIALDQLIAALQKTGNSKLASAWSEYRKDLRP